MRRLCDITLTLALAGLILTLGAVTVGAQMSDGLAERVKEAVVWVRSERGSASGFVFGGAGFVMTAAHAAQGARELQVRLHDGTVLDAEVVRFDRTADLAVLQVKRTFRRPLVFTDSFTQVSLLNDVFAVGYPALGGSTSFTMTNGSVAGFRRVSQNLELIQHTALIGEGSDGGPLVNRFGRVVGVVTTRAGGARLLPGGGGFAVSANSVRRLLLQQPSLVRPLLRTDSGGANQAPQARISAGTTSAALGQVVQLDASGSSDPDGRVAQYAWDLDGDGTADQFGANIDYRCDVQGTQTVTLTVTDDEGATGEASAQLSCGQGGQAAQPPAGEPSQAQQLLILGGLGAAVLLAVLLLSMG